MTELVHAYMGQQVIVLWQNGHEEPGVVLKVYEPAPDAWTFLVDVRSLGERLQMCRRLPIVHRKPIMRPTAAGPAVCAYVHVDITGPEPSATMLRQYMEEAEGPSDSLREMLYRDGTERALAEAGYPDEPVEIPAYKGARRSPAELWAVAAGEYPDDELGRRHRYRDLMHEEGHLVAGHQEPLPCGWTSGVDQGPPPGDDEHGRRGD